MANFVYVLSNPSIPGLLKVGCTNDMERRLWELYDTGVPAKFEIELQLSVPDEKKAEKLAHGALHECRFNPSREYFRVDARVAVETILEVVGPHEVVVDRLRYAQERAERQREEAARARAAQEAARRHAEAAEVEHMRQRWVNLEAHFKHLQDQLHEQKKALAQAETEHKRLGLRPVPARIGVLEKLRGKSGDHHRAFEDFVRPWDLADAKVTAAQLHVGQAQSRLHEAQKTLGPELERLRREASLRAPFWNR